MQNKKPLILLFIDWYVPGYKAGGPIRSCANMIAALRDEFDFKVVTRDSDYTEKKAYPGIVSNQWTKGRFGEEVYYFSEAQLNRKNLRQLILSVDYDRAYINGIYSYYFSILPLILCRKRHDKKIIIGTRGMLASTAIEVKSGKKKLFLNLARFAGIYRNVLFHATNENEANDIREAINQQAKIVVADNFPLPGEVLGGRISTKSAGKLRLINIARISPEKNLDFALRLLSDIHEGAIIFDVYGPVYNEDYFKSCQAIVRLLPDRIQVNFKGSLPPEKVGDTLQEYDLFIMTTKGENFGHSISESLRNGTPVLISDQTPWNEVNEKGAGRAIGLEHKEEFIVFIRQFLNMNQSEHQRMIDAALTLSVQKNDTSHLHERYRQLLSD